MYNNIQAYVNKYMGERDSTTHVGNQNINIDNDKYNNKITNLKG